MDKNPVPHHYYCVVETREAGRPVLTTVPQQWVNGKYLLWPPKNAEILRKDVTSQPAASWGKMMCKIKRRFIPSFNAAEQEVAEMSGVNTDSDFGGPPVAKKSRKKAPKNESIQGMDFNSHFPKKDASTVSTGACSSSSTDPAKIPLAPEVILVETLQQMASSSGAAPLETPIPWQENQTVHDPSNVSPETTEQQQQPDGLSNILTSDYVLNLNQGIFDGDLLKGEIIEKLENIKMEIIETVTKNVETLLIKTVSAMRSDFDAKIDLVQHCRSNYISSEVPQFTFRPMTSIQELQELEHNLADDEFARKLMKHMKQLIGTTGDQYNGQNVCYELIDKFFDRKLLTQCSWTGQSRSVTPKFAIQNCKNLLNLIFSIVKSVNEHFSEKALFDFFKSITRNAKRRSEAKLLRQSTVKRRCRKNVTVDPNQSDARPIESPVLNQSAIGPNEFADFNLSVMHDLLNPTMQEEKSVSESDEPSDSDGGSIVGEQ